MTKANSSIDLAGMGQCAVATNGQSIIFELESKSGKKYKFSCPYEAISEIVQNFELMGEMAWKVRGSPNETDVAEGTRGRAKARPVTGFQFAVSEVGIVLSMICGPVTLDMLLKADDCTRLSEALIESRKGWEVRQRPH
jgi:hypothetical protein